MLCYVILHYIILCYVMLYYTIFLLQVLIQRYPNCGFEVLSLGLEQERNYLKMNNHHQEI